MYYTFMNIYIIITNIILNCRAGYVMLEEKIEKLRKKLNKLIEKSTCLYSNEVVKLSQELDKLIYEYQVNSMYT